ncbi:hypothetical protein GWI33_017191 [Rhynchophorus ferrugineus]|uniref:Uncharacterized protein n=1 Tax=Rhynchophorus ferrugineus TaxID=354439 RepID=A0A834I9Q0_RHYFE|nr:hypothetical protein GWI33_017191 [Rhynchophorus ferrugineus]
MNILQLFMFTILLPLFSARTLKADVDKRDDSQENDPTNEELSSLMIKYLRQKISEKKPTEYQKSSEPHTKATYGKSENTDEFKKSVRKKQPHYEVDCDDDDKDDDIEDMELDPMSLDQLPDEDDSDSMETVAPAMHLRPIYPLYPPVSPMVYPPIRLLEQPARFPTQRGPIYNGFLAPYRRIRYVNI